MSDWNSEGSSNRNTVIRPGNGYPASNPIVNTNPAPNPYQNSYGNSAPANEMKPKKNSMNSLGEKGEEITKLSAFDELPYDFSKTDKIHRVSDLLRFLGIEEKRNDDGGLTVILNNHFLITVLKVSIWDSSLKRLCQDDRKKLRITLKP